MLHCYIIKSSLQLLSNAVIPSTCILGWFFWSAKRKIDWRGIRPGDAETKQDTVASVSEKDDKQLE